MAFSLERVAAAVKYWRCLPLFERDEKALKLAMMRHGLVEIDAKAYARDTIKNADDIAPLQLFGSLLPFYTLTARP